METFDSIPTNGTCLLCDKPAYTKPSEKYDADIVNCKRCGYFQIIRGALAGFEDKRYLLAGLIRRASTPKPRVEMRLMITPDNIEELLNSSGIPRDIIDQLDIALEYAKEHQTRGDQFVKYQDLASCDYPLLFTRDQEEFFYLLRLLLEQHLLDEPLGWDPMRRTVFRITPNGWARLRELSKINRDPNRAFVAMSFATELLPAWDDGIKLALIDLGFTPVRIDQTHSEDKIDDRIIAEIRKSGLLVADFTGHRGGVYFEAGFAMGLGIPVVWTCKKDDVDNAHFDTR
ncbi:hypothetical protein ACFLWZ_05535 [Chloroflexota bacterium]